MDGFEVLRALEKAPGLVRAIPVAILTGILKDTALGYPNTVNIVAHLEKPCSGKAMRTLLHSLSRASA